MVKYQRIMIKYSGEALLGRQESGIDTEIIANIAAEIKPLIAQKVQIGMIIGGGNFFRGAKLNQQLISRVTGDHLGMIATMLNAIAMQEVFMQLGISTKVMSALPVLGMIEGYNRNLASEYLTNNHCVIFAGGTGNPLVTTDTALSLRGIELGADLLLKATNVDGIYSADPRLEQNAQLYSRLTYQEALTKELAVMDLSAFCLCRDNKMKLRVFNMHKKGVLLKIMQGLNEGTLVE